MARGCIQKRGPTYYVVIAEGPKRRWHRAGHRRKDAEALRAKLVVDVNAGTYVVPKKATFAEFVDTWREVYLEGEVAKGNLRERTVANYESTLRKHLLPYFGRMEMRTIGAEAVERFVAKKAGELAPKTITNLLLQLSVMFNFAIRHKYVGVNPTKGVKRGYTPKREIQPLGFEDMPKFLDAAEPSHHALFATAIMTGMRKGELLGLRWDDVDWENGVIHVRRGTWRGKFTEPKTETSRRTVVMGDELAAILKRHKVACPASRDYLVFPNERGHVQDPGRMLSRYFYPTLRRAGLAKRTFHDLRHTYASAALGRGVPLLFVSKQMGHANPQTTLNIYGHLLPETAEDGHQQIGEIFKNVVNG